MRKKIADIKRKIASLEEDIEDALTPEDIAALDEAEEEYRSGRTVRLA